ncbi:class I SAM-dependent methyltransferase [Martelella mangrovi]|uniref:Ubiquinone/menaquinone biosynthesis C-methylase UbiE n=1 Tax=Martelella mangrovi TaxID=1397477 RepID=A0ABV2ICT1_9HYPH
MRFVDKYQPFLYPLIARTIFREVSKRIETVLDVGSGPGYLSVEMAARPPIKVQAIDINPTMLALAAKRADQRGFRSQIVFDTADVHQLPYKSNTFDLVVSYSCLHHWHDIPTALSECVRVLRPGGTLYIIDSYPDPQAVSFFKRMIPEPELARFAVQALEESLEPETIRAFVKNLETQNFEVADFVFDEEDMLEIIEHIQDSPFEEAPPNTISWKLVATK